MPSPYQKLESNETAQNPRETAGFVSILFFRWMNGIIELGKKSLLTIESLYPLSLEDEPEILTEKLEEAWNRELNEHRAHALDDDAETKEPTQPRLWRALLRFISKSDCALVLLLAGLRSTCLLVIPVLLYFLLLDVTDERGRLGQYILASCICVCAGIVALSVSHFQFRATLLGMRVRTAITGLLYKKVRIIPGGDWWWGRVGSCDPKLFFQCIILQNGSKTAYERKEGPSAAFLNPLLIYTFGKLESSKTRDIIYIEGLNRCRCLGKQTSVCDGQQVNVKRR